MYYEHIVTVCTYVVHFIDRENIDGYRHFSETEIDRIIILTNQSLVARRLRI